MATPTDTLAKEISRFDTITGTHTPFNAIEALLIDKLKAATRVLEMIEGLDDEVKIGDRSYAQTVDVARLKTLTVLALRTPGKMINLDGNKA